MHERYCPVVRDQAIRALRGRLMERMDRWSTSSLREATTSSPGFRELGMPLLEVVATERVPLAAWMTAAATETTIHGTGDWEADPIGFLAARLLRWVQSRNQFVDLGPQTCARAEELYRQSARELALVLAAPRPEKRVTRSGLVGGHPLSLTR